MLYVYAIADSTPDPLGIGLHGSSLRASEEAGLVALASEHGRPPEPTAEDLRRHEQVVERLMEQIAVLPLRFGATVACEAELRGFLAGRAEEFRALLEQVRGASELSVRVAPVSPAGATKPAGGELAQARVHEPLDALARHSRVVAARSGGFKAAYLVERNRVGAFVALVERLGESNPAPISCTGPLPPYSFVSGVDR